MHLEMKKLLQTKISLLVLVILIISGILGYFAGVHSYRWGDKAEVKGVRAANQIYNVIQKNSVLTAEVLEKGQEEYRADYQKYGADMAMIRSDNRFPNMALSYSYFVYNQPLDQVAHIENFYHDRTERIVGKAREDAKPYSSKELVKIRKFAQQTSMPIKLGDGAAWNNYFNVSTCINILFSILAVMIGTNLYSEEKNCCMDRILSSIGKKKFIRFICQKIGAEMIVISSSYAVCMLIMNIGYWRRLKFMYLKSSVQIAFVGTLYQGTIGTYFAKTVLGGLLSILMACLLANLFNLITGNRMKSFVLAAVFYYIPVLLNAMNKFSAAADRISSIQPVQGLFVKASLKSYHIYGSMRNYDAVLLVCFAGIAALFFAIELIARGKVRRG